MNSELTKKIQHYITKWNICASGWNFLHLILAFTATLSSLVVATFSTGMSDSQTKAFAFAAAISVGLISLFDLSARRRNYRDAWRHLNEYYLSYVSGVCTEENLIKAYSEGEKMIGHYSIKVEENGKKEDSKNV